MSIDKMLRNEGRKLDPSKNVYVVLLGPAGTGKSTVLKQLLLQYGHGFDDIDQNEIKNKIISDTINNFKSILAFVQKSGKKYDSEDLERYAVAILRSQPGEITPHMGKSIKELWNSSIIQDIYCQSSDLEIEDSTP